MRLISTKNKKRPFKPLWCVCWPLLAVLYLLLASWSGFFNVKDSDVKYLLAKEADASNIYIDDISFANGAGGILYMTFHTLVSFDITIGAEANLNTGTVSCDVGNIHFGESWNAPQEDYPFTIIVPDDADLHYTCDKVQHYVAGNTYTNLVVDGGGFVRIKQDTKKICVLNNCSPYPNSDYASLSGMPTAETYFTEFGKSQWAGSSWPMTDTEHYFFEELPTLTITFPQNNDEIAGAFNIQGSYTIPAGSDYNILMVQAQPDIYTFTQAITTTTGDVLIPVNDIPAGYYILNFWFFDTPPYQAPVSLTIHIVNDIPPALPTGETPPTIPVYPPTAPATYHADYCAYGTSTTPLFNTLTGAVSGMITSIGDNLADFAGRFSNTDAKTSGESLAGSVLLMRAYLGGFNSFFGDFPIGQVLILYLVVFVLVILFRVIKGLINLIKP